MGTKKIGQESTRTITQNSVGSYSVTLPIAEIRKLGWRKGQKIVIKRHGNQLVIDDWKN